MKIGRPIESPHCADRCKPFLCSCALPSTKLTHITDSLTLHAIHRMDAQLAGIAPLDSYAAIEFIWAIFFQSILIHSEPTASRWWCVCAVLHGLARTRSWTHHVSLSWRLPLSLSCKSRMRALSRTITCSTTPQHRFAYICAQHSQVC